MQQPRPYVIVVGIDYSKTSDLALQRAFEVATERRNAEVHIVHVFQGFAAMAPVDLTFGVGAADPAVIAQASEQLREYSDKRLQDFKAHVVQSEGSRLFGRAISHLRLDAPAHEIAQLASDLEADLVVVGTHGRRGASRLLLGSVAEGVVRLAPCQVLVVKPKAAEKKAEDKVPEIEPPCPRCVEARQASGGNELWCETHRDRHGRRHTYHQVDRLGAETNFPLVVPER